MPRTYLLAFFFVLLLPAAAQADDLSALMPDTIGEMKRIQLITGSDAQAEVDKLHGKALTAKASCIARYSRPGDVGTTRPAEVWVSRVSSAKEARRQTGLMVHKMYENPKSPFHDPKRINHNSQSVYRFSGMGQIHLIWFSDDLIYWISAAPGDQTAMLDAFGG